MLDTLNLHSHQKNPPDIVEQGKRVVLCEQLYLYQTGQSSHYSCVYI